jgi:hypothetical protein
MATDITYEFSVRFQNNPHGTKESDRKLRWYFDAIHHQNRDVALTIMGQAFWDNVPETASIVAIHEQVRKL